MVGKPLLLAVIMMAVARPNSLEERQQSGKLTIKAFFSARAELLTTCRAQYTSVSSSGTSVNSRFLFQEYQVSVKF